MNYLFEFTLTDCSVIISLGPNKPDRINYAFFQDNYIVLNPNTTMSLEYANLRFEETDSADDPDYLNY